LIHMRCNIRINIMVKEIAPDIIDACKRKTKAAQKALYNHYASYVYGICMRYAAAKQDAEDMMQDSFVKILKHIVRYQDYGSFTAWVKRITVNTAISYYRKAVRQKTVLSPNTLKHEADKPFYIDTHLFAEDIIKAVRSLPDGYRLIFNLYAIEGYDHVEISKMLGIESGSSRSQYYRARKLLQKKLESTYKEIKQP